MSKKACTGRERQGGFTYTAFLLIMSVSIFVGLFAIKIVPVYLENLTVAKIVDDLNKNTKLLSGSRAQIYQNLNQSYRTNSLWSLKARDTVVLTRQGPAYKASIKYEVRSKLFANIDLVTSFDTSDKASETVAEAKDT